MDGITMDLTFQGVSTGTVRNAFLSDGVWYGKYEPHHNGASSLTAKRAAEFVSFSIAWNEKIRVGMCENDASLFSSFSDVVSCNGWNARSIEGEIVVEIEDAPVFFIGDEVTFRAKAVGWHGLRRGGPDIALDREV